MHKLGAHPNCNIPRDFKYTTFSFPMGSPAVSFTQRECESVGIFRQSDMTSVEKNININIRFLTTRYIFVHTCSIHRCSTLLLIYLSHFLDRIYSKAIKRI